VAALFTAAPPSPHTDSALPALCMCLHSGSGYSIWTCRSGRFLFSSSNCLGRTCKQHGVATLCFARRGVRWTASAPAATTFMWRLVAVDSGGALLSLCPFGCPAKNEEKEKKKKNQHGGLVYAFFVGAVPFYRFVGACCSAHAVRSPFVESSFSLFSALFYLCSFFSFLQWDDMAA